MKMIIFAPRFSKIKDGCYMTMKVKYFLAISDKKNLNVKFHFYLTILFLDLNVPIIYLMPGEGKKANVRKFSKN